MKKDEEKGTTKEECNMTKEEIKKLLDNTKVYVNGKSEEIQKKLFSFGYYWYFNKLQKVSLTESPFLFIASDGITHSCDMCYFNNHKNKEITAEQILSLELTEGYRPFKDKNECWNEMLKHEPFGFLSITDEHDYFSICRVFEEEEGKPKIMFASNPYSDFDMAKAFNRCQFVDGTPFGVKEV